MAKRSENRGPGRAVELEGRVVVVVMVVVVRVEEPTASVGRARGVPDVLGGPANVADVHVLGGKVGEADGEDAPDEEDDDDVPTRGTGERRAVSTSGRGRSRWTGTGEDKGVPKTERFD